MRLTAILIGAVSTTVQAQSQWHKCEEIRKCNIPDETGWDADCWMSTGSEMFSNGEPNGRWVGNIQYTKLRNHPRFNTNSALWLVIDHFDGSYMDDQCTTFDGRSNCWRAIGKGRNLFKIMRGMDYRTTELNSGEIRWSAEFDNGAPGSMIADRLIICDADVHSFDVNDPEPTPPPPPSGQWDKCEEIEPCFGQNSFVQPAGWTSTNMLFDRVGCYLPSGNHGDVGVRQTEFEKMKRFNTNSALWIVVTLDFKTDAIDNQCEINQEEGCWRAIGKGERLFKVMRGMSYTTTMLDTTVIAGVDGSVNRMIICDADVHSFDVDEPEPEKPNPLLENKYCNNEIMWHNAAGEATTRWSISEEDFSDVHYTIDAEKIYTDGEGNYLWWTWEGFTGRWYLTK